MGKAGGSEWHYSSVLFLLTCFSHVATSRAPKCRCGFLTLEICTYFRCTPFNNTLNCTRYFSTRVNNRRGHWMWWLSTGRCNGLIWRNTRHIVSIHEYVVTQCGNCFFSHRRKPTDQSFAYGVLFKIFFLLITLLELQSRFGDKPLKFQVSCPQLSRKRVCSPKRVTLFPFQLLRPWFISLAPSRNSDPVGVTHSGSYPPSPLRLMLCIFLPWKASALSPLVDSRRIVPTQATVEALRCRFCLFLTILRAVWPRWGSNSRIKISWRSGLTYKR